VNASSRSSVHFSSAHGIEPYHENQKFAENRYATIKATTNRVMNFSGAPATSLLLALCYVCLLLNHLASSALGWKSPEQVLSGQRPDIFKFLHVSFYEPVYYHDILIHILLLQQKNKVGGLVLLHMLVMH
jgi:hypothetical protein